MSDISKNITDLIERRPQQGTLQAKQNPAAQPARLGVSKPAYVDPDVNDFSGAGVGSGYTSPLTEQSRVDTVSSLFDITGTYAVDYGKIQSIVFNDAAATPASLEFIYAP